MAVISIAILGLLAVLALLFALWRSRAAAPGTGGDRSDSAGWFPILTPDTGSTHDGHVEHGGDTGNVDAAVSDAGGGGGGGGSE